MGGAINGQVIMWDITKALTSIDQKKRKQSVRHIGKPGLGFGGDDDEVSAAALPPVKPCAVSHIDMSHRRLVADLVWLPTTTQVNNYDGWSGLQEMFTWYPSEREQGGSSQTAGCCCRIIVIVVRSKECVNRVENIL